MASAIHTRAPARSQRRSRKKRSYRELTSDEELSDISPIQARLPAVRSSKRVLRRSYKEDEDSSDASQWTSELDLPSPRVITPPRPSRTNTSSASRKRRVPHESSIATRDFLSCKRIKLSDATDIQEGSLKQVLQEQVPVSEKIPPWQELEYQILLQIFKYAAYPLYVGASHSQPTIQWLLDVSLLSRSFRAAALAALLHSPPIFPAARAHGLLRLLKQDQDALSTNYRTKIREVNVEVKNLLMQKGGVVLQDFVGRYTPLLSGLNIYHNFDLIEPTTWSKPSASKKNWVYPLHLFDALDDADIHLKRFSWNGRFPDAYQVLKGVPSLHLRPCLHSLQSLSLLNMIPPEKAPKTGIEGLLTTAFIYLPELKELAFENCGLLNDTVLANLPHNLHSLNLTTCPNVTSHGLGKFLQLHGHELIRLHLRGNQAMDLGYLPALGPSCPNLQIIEVDLTYTDPSPFHDIEPHYDELLPNGQPTWPSSLRVVEFANLRNLDAAEADGFFQSLVDSAHELKNLRRLSLKAILKAGWRDRARLREKWKMKLENVFLRKSPPPRLFWPASSRPLPKASSLNTVAGLLVDRRTASSHPASVGEDSDPVDKPSRSTATNRKSSRIAQKELESLKAPTVEVQPVTSSSGRRSVSNGPPRPDREDGEYIHGMVDEVVLRLDDQRPADAQFNEGDFLDSERSDEDWDGT